MSWIAIALLSAAIVSIVNIFDKTVIYRYATSPLTLPLLIGMAQTIVGTTVIIINGIPAGVTLESSIAAIISGIFFGLSGITSQRVLFTQEVSRTIPVTQSAPIFAAFLAMMFLNEPISLLQWGGILATVSGSVMLSIRVRDVGTIFLHKSFYMLMLSAFLFGAANVIGKHALTDLPILYTHGLRMFALGSVFLAFALRQESWRDVRGYFVTRSPALLFVGTNEFLTANIGILLMLWALSLGPASLVTALFGTRAFFVVLYSTGLALIWRGSLGEQTSPGTIAVKILSAMLIVAGIAAIANPG
jgi:uncharacterized membrane protein